MGIVITVIVVALVVAFLGGALLARLKSRADSAAPPETPPVPRPVRPEPAPMTGLEEALNKVTDRTGHTMADRLDAESDHVAMLRETDDTGPLLRRALDSVDRGPQAGAASTSGSTDPSSSGRTPNADEPDPEQP